MKAGLSGNLDLDLKSQVDLLLSSLSVTALYRTLPQAEGIHGGDSSGKEALKSHFLFNPIQVRCYSSVNRVADI